MLYLNYYFNWAILEHGLDWGASLDGSGLHLCDLLGGGGAVVCTGWLSMPVCRLGVRWCTLGDVNVHRELLHSFGP